MHKKFGKDRACGSADIIADRQTDPQTDIGLQYSSQYFATAPAGEVIIPPVFDSTSVCFRNNSKRYGWIYMRFVEWGIGTDQKS